MSRMIVVLGIFAVVWIVLAVGAFKVSGGGAGFNAARSAKPAKESGAAYVYY